MKFESFWKLQKFLHMLEKKFSLIFTTTFAALVFLSACSHKTTPNKSAAAAKNEASAAGANATTAMAVTAPIIIVDGNGKIMVTESNLPPGASKKIFNSTSARAFTPAQQKNLAYRYHFIPPKIIYVPDNLAKTSARGTYYIYKNKFWYWKKNDGYFYLDENYYQ
jgi:hypothetical protein